MNEVKKAAFNFENYKIESFSFQDSESDKIELSVNFEPSGLYTQSTGVFKLTFQFKALYNNEQSELINIILKADFIFNDKPLLAELPTYFYRNAIAIVFPYLRSFVTTLTAIANVKPLILPVLNLSGLEQPFKENTVLTPET